MPNIEARIMTKGQELSQLQNFFKNMDMLTKTTFEVVDQFNGITTDFEKISKHLERQKNRKEEINVMADLLDEKLNSLLEEAPSSSPRRW